MLYESGQNARLADREPSRADLCGVSGRSPRRAALLFDRVYVPYFASVDLSGASNAFIRNRTFGVRDLDTLVLKRVLEETTSVLSNATEPRALVEALLASSTKLGALPMRMAAEIYREEGFRIVATYSEDAKFYKDYGGDSHAGYQLTLSQIPVVDEGQLSWSLVEGFLEDPRARSQYRALHEFLQKPLYREDLKDPEVQRQISEEIAGKLAEYETAIRQRNLDCLVGGVSTVVSVGGVAASAGAGYLGLSISVASALLTVGSLMLARQSDRRGRANPLAIIYRMRDELGARHGT